MSNSKLSVFQKVFRSLLVCVLLTSPAFAAISDSEFVELCREGSLQQIVDAINDGANVNAKVSGGFTPLIFAAAINPNPEVITVLIHAGADVNARTDEGWSAEGGLSPLMAAVVDKSLYPDSIMALINAGADVNAKNRAGWTPLILAAGNDNSNPDIIRALIDAGADVNARTIEDGSTPLVWAAERCSNPEVITVLLDSGANPAARKTIVQNRGGNIIQLAIDLARDNINLKDTEVLKRLEEETHNALLTERRNLDFLELCKTGSIQRIKDAIRNGANINARFEVGRTPLMLTVFDNSSQEVVTTLISEGADVHLRDEHEWTPIMFAAGHNSNPEVITAIIEAGADVNAIDVLGFTPLMLAAFNNTNPEVITILLEFGADPQVKNRTNNMTAIEYAQRNQKLKKTDALKKLEEMSR